MTRATEPQIVMESLRRIVQALRQSATYSEKVTGVTAAQLLVLKRIEGREGLSVNELATLTFTHQSTVSEIISRLETRGLLRRARATTDGRRVELYLTEAGQHTLGASPVSAHEKLMEAVTTLPPQTLGKLAEGLEALIEAAHLNEHPARFFFEDKSDAK